MKMEKGDGGRKVKEKRDKRKAKYVTFMHLLKRM